MYPKQLTALGIRHRSVRADEHENLVFVRPWKRRVRTRRRLTLDVQRVICPAFGALLGDQTGLDQTAQLAAGDERIDPVEPLVIGTGGALVGP
jgi:hypothetical protein